MLVEQQRAVLDQLGIRFWVLVTLKGLSSLVVALMCDVLLPCREAESFKEQGNVYYAKKDYNEAYNYYTKAIGESDLGVVMALLNPVPENQNRLWMKCMEYQWNGAASSTCRNLFVLSQCWAHVSYPSKPHWIDCKGS